MTCDTLFLCPAPEHRYPDNCHVSRHRSYMSRDMVHISLFFGRAFCVFWGMKSRKLLMIGGCRDCDPYVPLFQTVGITPDQPQQHHARGV